MLLAALFVCNRVLLGAIGSCAAGAIWQSCRITAVRMCVCSSRFFLVAAILWLALNFIIFAAPTVPVSIAPLPVHGCLSVTCHSYQNAP